MRFWRQIGMGVCAIAAAVVLASEPTRAQVSRVTAGFQSDASRYVWNAGVDLDRRGPDWSFTFTNQFRSEAFLLSRQLDEFRDENYAVLRMRQSISPTVAAVGFGEGDWFSQNSSSTVEGYGGLRYTPRPFLMVESGAGAVVDRKPGLLLEGQTEPDVLVDTGPGLSLAGVVSESQVGGFAIEASTRNRWHFISPRFGRSLNAVVSAVRPFDRGRFRVQANFGDLVRQSYQASSLLNRLEDVERADDTIESTQSDTAGVGLELEFPLTRRWRFVTTASYEANSRFVRTLRAPEDELFFDTNFNRQMGDLQAVVAYDDPATTLRFTASRSVTAERRRLDNADELPPGQAAQKSAVLRQADFDRSVFWVRAVARRSVSRWLALRGAYRASILRHDTPIANLDDRDESVFDGELGVVFYLNRTVELDVRLFGVRHHTVYLDGSRSGENHERRSLRLVPAIRWRPTAGTDISLRSEVRAVYTTDDFNFPDQPQNDQSARELSYTAGFSQDLGGDASIHFDGRVSELHLGRLLWEDFEEIPFDTLSTSSGWLRFEVGRKWRADVGARVFFRSEFERSLTVRYEPPGSDGTVVAITRAGRKRLLQIGPTASFSLPMSKSSEVRMAGWIQFQQTRLELYGTLPPDDEESIIEAGRTAERRTIPNLTISVLWNL